MNEMTKELFLDKRTYSEYSTAYIFLFVLLFLCLKNNNLFNSVPLWVILLQPL